MRSISVPESAPTISGSLSATCRKVALVLWACCAADFTIRCASGRPTDAVSAVLRNPIPVIVTTSPVLLDRADVVLYLHAGRVAATGTHRSLLATEPGYRALVSRTDADGSDGDGAAVGSAGHSREGAR